MNAFDDRHVPDASLTDPVAVVGDPSLTRDEKRAVLASWASDRRAVRDNPGLRRLESGSVVRIDDILDALKTLDHDDDDPPSPAPASMRVRPPMPEGAAAVAAAA